MASRAALQRAMRDLEPPLVRAFLRAVAEIAGSAQIRVLTTLVEEGRVDDIMDILGLDQARLSDVLEQVRTSYVRTGAEATRDIPVLRTAAGGTLRVRFDARNPRAEAWLRQYSSQFVTAIRREQREAIRVALEQGALFGRNPRATALDLVGRIGPTGRRVGGIVGLTGQQAGYVARMRAELADPELMSRYFTRARRDRRFDATVRRAMAEGRPLTAAQIDRIAGRYSDRLLQLRGETIARTETLAAFNEARDEAFRQAVDTGLVSPENVTREWQSTGDGRERDTHGAMHGQIVGLNQPFTSPSGAMLMHPGDTSLGAGPEEVINCRCTVFNRIDFAAELLG